MLGWRDGRASDRRQGDGIIGFSGGSTGRLGRRASTAARIAAGCLTLGRQVDRRPNRLLSFTIASALAWSVALFGAIVAALEVPGAGLVTDNLFVRETIHCQPDSEKKIGFRRLTGDTSAYIYDHRANPRRSLLRNHQHSR